MKNNQKGFIVPLLLAIIAILVIGGGVYLYNNKKAEAPLLKSCPSEKISDQMPGGFAPTAYFILNGQRRELKEFDLNWVKKNCTVKEQIAY